MWTRLTLRTLPTVLLACLAAAAAAQAVPWRAPPAAPAAPRDPGAGEVPLAAADGWTAFLVHRGAAGVWYAHIGQFVEAYGSREIVCTDDDGRFLLLSVYSGKWTEHAVVPDGLWLAPSRPADVDPNVPGPELYAAGRAGSMHQVTALPQPMGRFLLQSREVGHVGGEEFHAVLAADVDRSSAGCELLGFGITGALYRFAPGDPGGPFAVDRLATLPGRARDTVVLPGTGGTPTVVAALRSGHLLAMRFDRGEVDVQTLALETSGLGRVARRPPRDGEPEVVYAARDDGVLLRFELRPDRSWQRSAILAGDQGLRGVAAGRFHADGREAVAVYGYGREVQVVSRAGGGPWEVETIFRGAQQGHWLAVGELDGRNGTDELVATGFDGDVVLLARPRGHGLDGAAVPGMAPTSATGQPIDGAAARGVPRGR